MEIIIDGKKVDIDARVTPDFSEFDYYKVIKPEDYIKTVELDRRILDSSERKSGDQDG